MNIRIDFGKLWKEGMRGDKMQSLFTIVKSIRDLKAGMQVTLIDKGITRSGYSDPTWITEDRIGKASFFEVTKAGQIYIRGYGFFFEPEDKKFRKSCYESKYLFDDYVIIVGFSRMAKERYAKHEADIRTYEELKTDAEREIGYKINDIQSKMLDKWRNENPRPKALEI